MRDYGSGQVSMRPVFVHCHKSWQYTTLHVLLTASRQQEFTKGWGLAPCSHQHALEHAARATRAAADRNASAEVAALNEALHVIAIDTERSMQRGLVEQALRGVLGRARQAELGRGVARDRNLQRGRGRRCGYVAGQRRHGDRSVLCSRQRDQNESQNSRTTVTINRNRTVRLPSFGFIVKDPQAGEVWWTPMTPHTTPTIAEVPHSWE